MILTKVVDVTEVTDAHRENCIPMLEVDLQRSNRGDHAIEDNNSCQAAGQSGEWGEEAVGRNGPKAGTIIVGKPAPPQSPPVPSCEEAGGRREEVIGSCPTATTSGTSKPPPPLPPSQLKEEVFEKTQNADEGQSKIGFKAPPPNVLGPHATQSEELKTTQEYQVQPPRYREMIPQTCGEKTSKADDRKEQGKANCR